MSVNEFGYQQQLRRELRVRDLIAYGLVFMVVIAPFGIFGSVFQASGGMVALAYVVGALAMILTASSYGVMVAKYPVAGSVYGYAGRAIAPAAGFLTGWAILLDYVCIPLLLSLVAGASMTSIVPSVPTWAWVVIFVLANTVMNVFGIRVTKLLNRLFLAAELAVLVIFLAYGLRAVADGEGHGSVLDPLYNGTGFTWSLVLGGVSIGMLSYLGFDALAVHVVSLTPASPVGISTTFPHFGALTSTGYTRTLQAPLEERVWLYDLDPVARTVRYRARRSDFTVDLPLAPMLGTVGVAPAAGEVRQTIVPDVHGGNLDTPLLGPGATLYLGVNVPGALLALGDGHARQGDGEVCGVAVEVAMDVTIVVDVIPGVATGTPRLETDTQLVSLGAARPLEDAFRISQEDLVRHVGALTGLDPLDAYQLVSQTASARAGNVVDPQYVMSAGIDKRYLPGAVAYGGVHDRLRAG